MSPWNSSPIHIVFYKDTPIDILARIVEVHCKDHHETVKNMCMSLMNQCLENDDCHYATAKGTGHDIRVDKL